MQSNLIYEHTRWVGIMKYRYFLKLKICTLDGCGSRGSYDFF